MVSSDIVPFIIIWSMVGLAAGSPSSVGEEFTYQCFKEKQIEVLRPRFASPDRDPIGIQVSHRVSHQLVSRVYAIFLREVLGYQNVSLVDLLLPEEDDERLRLFISMQTLVSTRNRWPVPTIDLEIWMLPDSHVVPPEIVQNGALTEPGRYGWFIPKQCLINSTLPSLLPYTIFDGTDMNQLNKFILKENILNVLQEFGDRSCPPHICRTHVGLYEPAYCVSVECATLIAPGYRETSFVVAHIEEFRFRVKVLWLADNLSTAIDWLLAVTNRPFVVLHWTPSDIIDGGRVEFSAVQMPRCEFIQTRNITGCKYELMPILKYCAKNFKSVEYAMDALSQTYFPRKVLLDLLRRHNAHAELQDDRHANRSLTKREDVNGNSMRSRIPLAERNWRQIYNQIACDWIKSNKEIYDSWMPHGEKKETINIGGIFPMSMAWQAYQGIPTAAIMAQIAINTNETILPNHKLVVLRGDGQCRTDVVMKTFVNYYMRQEKVIGVLGPACSDTVEPIAGVSKHFRMAVISYSAEGASFSDRNKYPYFFRTIGSNRQYEQVYLRLLKTLGWKRIAALAADGEKYTEYIAHMESSLKKHDIELISNKKFAINRSANEMKKYLSDLKDANAKIIIADINDNAASLILCEAYKLKMTAKDGFVWFLPAWLTKQPHSLDTDDVSCSDQELADMLNGHFSLSPNPFAESSATMQENKSVGEWRRSYATECNQTLPQSVPQSDYAGYTYDAVWVFALALDRLITEDASYLSDLHSVRTTNRLMELIWDTDFNGVSGHIRFDDGGSRFTAINIVQWLDGSSRLIGSFSPNISEETGQQHHQEGSFFFNTSAVVWLNSDGDVPTDGTVVCNFAFIAMILTTDCEHALLAIWLTFFGLIVACLSLASFMYWKHQYDQKLKRSARVMRNFGIDLLSPISMPLNTLDKWEIPKDRIVINRRLGEGAFGTVFGGEAQITEPEWTAVAVKTLKSGSTTEARLDFLSEAEAMKRFDHKNIVQLLGVCLQTEPIYTIMEYMLYGDLKTYLLARRHLLKDKITEDADVAPKRLTMMALDVARGLSYLADQKYVHRDIACRNCLVNAHKSIKIGDFGMARPMYESDYYKFNRKGMLPVRWMAPESLGLGIFTPASDVWSFGVLLYEIITFGSFPFQGLTNKQVLEHVKNGTTLTIPYGVRPHLEGLIKSCWNMEHKKRPSAAEIVAFICNQPRLVVPCLDVPLASVQMATDSDQIEIMPATEKRIPGTPVNDSHEMSRSATSFTLPEIRVNEAIGTTAAEPLLLHESKETSVGNLALRRYMPMCGNNRQKL